MQTSVIQSPDHFDGWLVEDIEDFGRKSHDTASTLRTMIEMPNLSHAAWEYFSRRSESRSCRGSIQTSMSFQRSRKFSSSRGWKTRLSESFLAVPSRFFPLSHSSCSSLQRITTSPFTTWYSG